VVAVVVFQMLLAEVAIVRVVTQAVLQVSPMHRKDLEEVAAQAVSLPEVVVVQHRLELRLLDKKEAVAEVEMAALDQRGLLARMVVLVTYIFYPCVGKC
jgi:hypothetical protein